MKNTRSSCFSHGIALFTVPLVALLLLFSACQKEPCEAINCTNGGTCSNGLCQCPEGYAGVTCELKLNPCDNKNCADYGTDSCTVRNNIPYCVCAEGWMGPLCDSTWAQPFFGQYNVTETCTAPNGTQTTTAYDTPVKTGTKSNSLEISRFHGTPSARLIVDVVGRGALGISTQGMLFSFPPDTIKAFVEGGGAKEASVPNGFVLTYTIRPYFTTDTTTCVAIFRR